MGYSKPLETTQSFFFFLGGFGGDFDHGSSIRCYWLVQHPPVVGIFGLLAQYLKIE